MSNQINICYGDKSYELPENLIKNEDLMREIVSASVWNNQLQKSDKVNLLKFLPNFPKNDTREKKDTLKKIFLGKHINFENQIHKFVSHVKDGDFDPKKKAENVIQCLMDERSAQIRTLKRKLNDLRNIVEIKKKKGLSISEEEECCLNKYKNYLDQDDPLASTVERRFDAIMNEISSKAESIKIEVKECKLKQVKVESNTNQECKSVKVESRPSPVVNMKLLSLISRCQANRYKETSSQIIAGELLENDVKLSDVISRSKANRIKELINNHNETINCVNNYKVTSTRKRKQQFNGCSSGKILRLHYEQCSSADSASDYSLVNGYDDDEDDYLEDEFGYGDSISETDSLCSGTSKKKHEFMKFSDDRREFRCPQDDFPDFFCLLQRLFQGAHKNRLSVTQLENRVRHWQTIRVQRDHISQTWAPQLKDWSTQVVSALSFLSPTVVEYKNKLQLWSWKRDRTADELSDLFFEWRSIPANNNDGSFNGTASSSNHSSNSRGAFEEVPAPLYPTDWTCRAYTPEEKANFHQQERRRFMRPWRGFIYNINGYDCAVGPLRGCCHSSSGDSISTLTMSTINGGRARGHPLLLSERPAHVTIVEIVRDAVARLPNGQGSRADIASLASESQYWSTNATERGIAQCVSSALDRLQGEPGGDPSVRYNARLKLWFYRHRHKTMAELELAMIAANSQQQQQQPSPTPSSTTNSSSVTSHHVTPTQFFHQNQFFTTPPTPAPPSQFLHPPPPPIFSTYPPHHFQPPITLPSGPSNTQHSYQQFSQAISNARELLQHQPPIHNRIAHPIRLSSTAPPIPPGHHHRVFVYPQSPRITSAATQLPHHLHNSSTTTELDKYTSSQFYRY